MFPLIGDLTKYLFGFNLPFPVQTLGFFVALSFFGAYLVFTSEFKRYEAFGKIRAFTRKVVIGRKASFADLAINFLLGFLLGFKVVGAIIEYSLFAANPRSYLFSMNGNLIAGALAGVALGLWIYFDKKKNVLAQPKTADEIKHPYQLMGLIVFSVGFFGFIGAKLFDVAEHLDQLWYNPIGTLFSTHGFAYYGGLIFGALTYLYIGHRFGMKLVHLADIGSPGMMLAYGIGRIGCQLSGDGDWGVINMQPKPKWLSAMPNWMWTYHYPHNSINAGINIPGCTGSFCNQLVSGVFPTSFYEAVLCIGMFALMWIFRNRIKIPGLMFSIYLILNGGERFLIEHIRINFYYRVFGFTFTQAEIIGGLMLVGGLIGLAIIAYNYSKGQYRKYPVAK